MIAYLEGKIILKKDKFAVVETGGVGYKVFLNRQTLLRLSAFAPEELRRGKPEIFQPVKLYIHHDIGEDKSNLYGFLTYEELEFFEILNDIRGVGPKAALEISVVGPLEKIKDKILKHDENVFAGIPGIGAKRASSIILELTGKLSAAMKSGSAKNSPDEAENALMGLGFSKQQAKGSLEHVPPDIKNTEERIKLALKNLGK